MSYVIAAPEMMTAAATDLAAIGSNVSAAHMAAAAPTVAVIPAAGDEVSANIAHLLADDLANIMDAKLVAAAFGMTPEAAMIYLADYVDADRLAEIRGS